MLGAKERSHELVYMCTCAPSPSPSGDVEEPGDTGRPVGGVSSRRARVRHSFANTDLLNGRWPMVEQEGTCGCDRGFPAVTRRADPIGAPPVVFLITNKK